MSSGLGGRWQRVEFASRLPSAKHKRALRGVTAGFGVAGTSIGNLAELIAPQGIWVSGVALPDGIRPILAPAKSLP